MPIELRLVRLRKVVGAPLSATVLLASYITFMSALRDGNDIMFLISAFFFFFV